MPLMVWLASAAVAVSLPVAWFAVAGDRQLTHRVSRNLVDHPTSMRAAVLERSAAERLLAPMARGVGARLLRFTPTGWVGAKAEALAKAGLTGRITTEQLLGAKILLPLLIGGFFAFNLTASATFSSVVFALVVTIVAFFGPDLVVRSIADRRADEITSVLPDVLDQLTISVEAGLGFEAALARIVKSDTHALAQEFGRMLQDIQFGTGRTDALDALAKRSQVDDLKTVVLSLRQAEALGVPLAQTLRNLSSEMREKRRFRAEEKAHQLPIKMIFPLGLCILPALFIVIIGPAVVSFVELF
ncbi:MAG: type II secretion system F family protein [Acidimicrobiia bacterium]|nr:type II secretion system F family protein [Acidimicrobiia bacterium]